MHEKHRGHEAMHAEMAFILLLTLIVAQIALVQWKIHHFKSYQVHERNPLGVHSQLRYIMIMGLHIFKCLEWISGTP